MTVSPERPRDPARPPRAAGAFLSAYRRILAAIAASVASAWVLLRRAWRELQEIERRESGRPVPPENASPPSPGSEPPH